MFVGAACAAGRKIPTDDIARSLASSFGVAQASLEQDCTELTDGTICFFYPELVDLDFKLEGSDMTMSVTSRSITADENGPLPQGQPERASRIKAFVDGDIFLIKAVKPSLSDAECRDFLKAAIERATKQGSIKEAEWLDDSSPGSLRFNLTRDHETLRFEIRMAFDLNTFRPRPVRSESAVVIAAIDASFPDEVGAFAGGKALFVKIRTEDNVICAEDSPALMVHEVNGQYIALNGTTRSWSRQVLRVFRGSKWHAVLDPDNAPSIGSDEIRRMIDVGLRLCPAPEGVEDGYRRVLQGEQNRRVLGAKYFGLD